MCVCKQTAALSKYYQTLEPNIQSRYKDNSFIFFCNCFHSRRVIMQRHHPSYNIYTNLSPPLHSSYFWHAPASRASSCASKNRIQTCDRYWSSCLVLMFSLRNICMFEGRKRTTEDVKNLWQ
jgi:hypothetical protein